MSVSPVDTTSIDTTSIDTRHRELCHALFDALERGDVDAVDRCYAPDMTMWCNFTKREQTREENLASLIEGKKLLRRRTYDDRQINTFDDGFVAQYTVTAVTHDGTKRALWACLVAEVHDGRITKLFDYLDTSKFGAGAGPR